MNNFDKQPLQLATLVALSVTFVVSSAGNFFPEFMKRITEWQIEQIEEPKVHQAITIFNLNSSASERCGKTPLDRTLLAQTITALSQAEAKVIAPMLPLEGPSSSACGGASADATLIEATTLSGRVIYATSAFAPLKDQALGIGHLDPRPSLDTETLPLGLAIAKGYNPSLAIDFSPWPVSISWAPTPASTYDFDTLRDLIDAQQWTDLRSLVENKIVLLTSAINEADLVQVQLLNAALTNSWLYPIGIQAQAFIVFVLSFSTAWMLLKFPNWTGYSTPLSLFILCIATAVTLQAQVGLILPLFGFILALVSSTASIRLYQAKTLRVHTSTQLQTLERNLFQIQQDLTLKETNALSLTASLNESRLAEQQSTDRLKQLEQAQAEVETTKQHMKEVEAELATLRKDTAETVAPSPLPHNLESLSLESQALGILTKDPTLLKVFSDLKRAAKSHNPILLLGETGTGKEVFAKTAHRLSDRARHPFIPVNMAAIRPELFESELFGHAKGAFTGAVGSKGYVEAADGGTLFLDEMGELGLDLQAKLLRLLENQTFNRVGEAHTRQANVRILIATNRDLKQEVEQGRFREDLYYRLRSIVLFLPALRERVPEDRRLLAQHFLQQFATHEHRGDFHLHPEALQTIVSYSWPGNIRELKQTLSQAVSLAETQMLMKADLRLDEHQTIPLFTGQTPKHAQPKKSPTRDDTTILTALRQHRFDMGATAQDLNCDRSTITQRLKGLGYEALVKNQGDFTLAAKDLANDESLENVVEQKLREYEANLLPVRKRYHTVEEAIADCRRRFKNLPDRYLPSVEILIRNRFSASS